MAGREFDGKTVVITGAAGGLGRALADRFGRARARLALLDLDGPAIDELAAGLTSRGWTCFGHRCDVSDEASCEQAFEAIASRFGDVDVLINNAGITHRSSFVDTDSAVMRKVIEVNLFGSMYCTKQALEGLIRRRGQIVVLSSVAGLGPLDGRAGYSASKHALHGMFDTLRSELRRHGVGVTLVCPTFVATGIGAAAMGADGGSAPQPQATVGKVATAEQIADRILKAAVRRQRLLIPSLTGKMSRWIHLLSPRLFEFLMSRAVRAELEK